MGRTLQDHQDCASRSLQTPSSRRTRHPQQLERHPSQAISFLNSICSLFSNSTFCIRTLYVVCKCYKVCFFPSHTTITLRQVHSLPSQTTQTTQQSPPSIQQAYITLYIKGSFHTLHSVYFQFPHTNTKLSIPSTTLTIFVLCQTQQSRS